MVLFGLSWACLGIAAALAWVTWGSGLNTAAEGHVEMVKDLAPPTAFLLFSATFWNHENPDRAKSALVYLVIALAMYAMLAFFWII